MQPHSEAGDASDGVVRVGAGGGCTSAWAEVGLYKANGSRTGEPGLRPDRHTLTLTCMPSASNMPRNGGFTQ
jgi:hypothetical protein